MSERMHALAQMLTGKNSVEECTVEELQQLVDEHPYFAPARFLLLQKTAQVNSELYGPELQKSLLYYHNPLAFQHFIAPERFYTETPTLASMPEEAVTIPENDEYVNGETTAVEQEIPNLPEEPQQDVETGVSAESAADDTGSLPVDEENDTTEIEIPRLKIDLSVAPADQKLSFEPYHTVDYFASQGIKPAADEKPKDKFGQQVRSFTDWLKVMKKLPATDVSKGIDPAAEKNVEHLAADSVNQAEVVTEAMAEVWLKQGNRQKAIETYNKLILQNPSKKSFFAAKIENLKQS